MGRAAAARRAVIAAGMATQARLAEAIGSRLGSSRVSNAPGQPAGFELDQVERAVVVRPDEIGDFVLTSAFLREFRRMLPAAHITLVVKPEVLPLAELCPHINEIQVYVPRARWRPARPLVLPLRALRFALGTLRPARPELVVLPRWDGDQCYATFLARWSGAAWRVGYSERASAYKQTINRGFDQLLTHALDARALRHDVERGLDIVSALGGRVASNVLELWLDRADYAVADRALAPRAVQREDRPLIAFGVGAGHAKRRWPAERFAEVARRLQHDHNAAIVVVGGARDQSAQRVVLATLGPDAVGLAGTLTLRQTAAVLARSALYIGNDSGPMHLAAASGVPAVEISCHPLDGDPLHENAPERFAPWGVPYAALRPEHAAAPCTDACAAPVAHCILQVSVDPVVEAARTLIRARSARQRVVPIA